MMSKFLRYGVMAAFLTTVSAASADAQVPQPAPAPTSVPGTGVSNQFRAKQVLGTRIMIMGNTAAGTVDDLVFDDAGNLEYLIVENNGKLWTVPWEAAKFDLEKKMAMVPLTMEQYKTIPTYTTTSYPTFYTPVYRTQTYKYYGLTPRELRRIERR